MPHNRIVTALADVRIDFAYRQPVMFLKGLEFPQVKKPDNAERPSLARKKRQRLAKQAEKSPSQSVSLRDRRVYGCSAA